MNLRQYQLDIIDEISHSFRQGYKSPCVVLGCGGGKSIIAAEIARRTTNKGNRVEFLDHRKELCDQIRETFTNHGVDMDLCNINMVQTLTRHLDRMSAPSLIITDENHHCLAESYKRIYEAFPNAYNVGFTATPRRLNGGGLGDINDKLIIGKSTKWLIQNGYLAPYEYFSHAIADLNGLRSRNGEYIASDITSRMDKPEIHGDVIKHYRELADGKKAICYCASIVHSESTAAEFCKAGIAAEHIDGKTPKLLRDDIIQRFRDGTTQILCNVDLISEGFDVPDCGAAILLRPTKSLVLYIQQSMRCMRYVEGKTATIIDHVGNYKRHGLPDQNREWTLETKPQQTREQGDDEINIRSCPMCYYTHITADICPKCGFVYEKKSRKIKWDKKKRLERITSIVLDYQTPDQCKTIDELYAYAKRKNYKRGWAYHQAKARGLIS